jgi:glycerol kinase
VDVILGIDHGTTRTKVLAIDGEMRVVAEGVEELRQLCPQPGWVEQRPEEILTVTLSAIRRCISRLPSDASIVGVGLANQGETVLVWDRNTGEPLYNAIVWQDRRTATQCAQLARDGWGRFVHARTGLYLDPYFSATKVRWILDRVPSAQALAEAGQVIMGTTDTWLLWHLSKRRLHMTDLTTASRTLLLNLATLEWDQELLDLFRLPRAMLPGLAGCADRVGIMFLPDRSAPVPIVGLAVDQQAALFGHACFTHGMAKATYGTGTFVLMNAGDTLKISEQGLTTTLAWSTPLGTAYALEGAIYTTGAVVQWLVALGILSSVEESATLAQSLAGNEGVYFVPALAGLAAPHWDTQARGLIIGLMRGHTRAHIARAALEGIAYRVRDVLTTIENETGLSVTALRVDGGPTGNSFLMQFQADILNTPVQVAATTETTARGAALLAGLGLRWWTLGDISRSWRPARQFEPKMPRAERDRYYSAWRRALPRAKDWHLEGPPEVVATPPETP